MLQFQEECWDALCELSGEDVARLLTDYHGLKLFDEGFREFLGDEGVLPEIEDDDEDDDDEIEDNCENETYNCNSCMRDGDCPYQGIDGRPKFEDDDEDAESGYEISTDDLDENGELYCKECGSWLVKSHHIVGGGVIPYCSSDFIGARICRSCVEEHCLQTSCLGCDWGSYPDCKYKEWKEIAKEASKYE